MALVVGGHEDAIQAPCEPDALVNALDHGLAVDLRERLPRRRVEAKRAGMIATMAKFFEGPRVRAIVSAPPAKSIQGGRPPPRRDAAA
jgi:hypothetical protein